MNIFSVLFPHKFQKSLKCFFHFVWQSGFIHYTVGYRIKAFQTRKIQQINAKNKAQTLSPKMLYVCFYFIYGDNLFEI